MNSTRAGAVCLKLSTVALVPVMVLSCSERLVFVDYMKEKDFISFGEIKEESLKKMAYHLAE